MIREKYNDSDSLILVEKYFLYFSICIPDDYFIVF